MTTPPTTREEIPKFYAGGKALSKSEVVVTYKDHLAAMASATKEREESVTKARDQEAKLWFETWYSHYIAPEKPLPGEFGKFATERIQMTGYQRDHALTPPEKTTSESAGDYLRRTLHDEEAMLEVAKKATDDQRAALSDIEGKV